MYSDDSARTGVKVHVTWRRRALGWRESISCYLLHYCRKPSRILSCSIVDCFRLIPGFSSLVIYALGGWLWKTFSCGAEGVENLPGLLKLWAQFLYTVSKQRKRYIYLYICIYVCVFMCIWLLVYMYTLIFTCMYEYLYAPIKYTCFICY